MKKKIEELDKKIEEEEEKRKNTGKKIRKL